MGVWPLYFCRAIMRAMASISILVDRVKVVVQSSGVGPFLLGPAVKAYRGVEALQDGATYSYAIESGAQYEVGTGTYIQSSGTLVRTPILSSNGGAAVSFRANAELNFTALAQDIVATGATLPIVQAGGTNPAVVMSQKATSEAVQSRMASEDLASTDSNKGSGYAGFSISASYPATSIGYSLKSRGVFATDFPYGAKLDGSDDSAAINQSIADRGYVLLGPGTLKTDTAAPRYFKVDAFGTGFTGTNRLNRNFPQFGGVRQLMAVGGENCLVGIAHNNRDAGTIAFPTAVTGYGRNDSNGNTVFGGFFRADQYASSGVVTNEVNSFNWSGVSASGALPPDRSFGTSQLLPVGLTVAAGGNASSAIGIQIGMEGEAPQRFRTGLYVAPGDLIDYGIFLDADGSSTYSPLVVKSSSAKTAITLLTTGTAMPANAALTLQDPGGAFVFTLRNGGGLTVGGDIVPFVDNAVDLGRGDARMRNIYAASGAINPSDAELKEWRGALNAAEVRASMRIARELGFYQWKEAIAEKGEDLARWHFGVRAQNAFSILEDEGLDWRKYAWCCFDEWDDAPAVLEEEIELVEEMKPFPIRTSEIDDEGLPIFRLVDRAVKTPQPTGRMIVKEPAREKGSLYGIRPDQLALFLIAGLLAQADMFEGRLAKLEAAS